MPKSHLALLFSLALTFLAPGSFAQTNVSGVLLFKNGDVLQGEMSRFDTTNGIRWQHPQAAGYVEFKPEFLDEIRFTVRPPESLSQPNRCLVRLANDDQFEGTFLELGNDKLVIDTWQGGRLEIPRGTVRLLLPLGSSGLPVYQGPDSAEGWTAGKVNPAIAESGEWRYRNGAFYANRSASIARDLKLPDVARLQFRLEWRGFFHMAIALYTDKLQPVNLASKENEPEFGGFYSLQINTFTANLIPIKKNDPLRYLGQVGLGSLNQKSSADWDIRMNKAKKSFALLLDGVLVKEWVDPEAFAGAGTAVRFVHQGQGAVKLSKLKVSHWDGQFEEKPTPRSQLKLDLVKLKNGDKLDGSIQSLTDSKVVMASSERTVEVPLTRVKQIEFRPDANLSSDTRSNYFRGFLADGGQITFELLKWDAESILIKSPYFGLATLNPNSFNRLKLNQPNAIAE